MLIYIFCITLLFGIRTRRTVLADLVCRTDRMALDLITGFLAPMF